MCIFLTKIILQKTYLLNNVFFLCKYYYKNIFNGCECKACIMYIYNERQTIFSQKNFLKTINCLSCVLTKILIMKKI